jgi:hypothetical protein
VRLLNGSITDILPGIILGLDRVLSPIVSKVELALSSKRLRRRLFDDLEGCRSKRPDFIQIFRL